MKPILAAAILAALVAGCAPADRNAVLDALRPLGRVAVSAAADAALDRLDGLCFDASGAIARDCEAGERP